MSTIKADAITAVSTNGDLSLDGLGTGGVSIASTLKMTKGGDISSASPLVIDVDGNYFDVTGTTNFAAMTVESGNFFMLQFDGALTITHGSGIELPGAANLTTATGDRLICYATAANTVEVMSVETEAAASSGGFTQGTEQATTSGTAITFGSIPSGVSMIVVHFASVSTGSTSGFEIEIGDSGGLETAGYISTCGTLINTSIDNGTNNTDAYLLTKLVVATNHYHGQITLTLEDATNFTWIMSGITIPSDGDVGGGGISYAAGSKSLSAELTQLKFTAQGDTFDLGAINIMYQ